MPGIMDLRELKKRAHALTPIVSVGKAGLTQGIVEQVLLELKARRLVKVRLLKSALAGEEKHVLAQRLAEKTQSALVSQIGNVVVLHR